MGGLSERGDEQADAGGERECPGDIRTDGATSTGRGRQHADGTEDEQRADGQVHQEGRPPAETLDEEPADRGTSSGSNGTGRTPRPHRRHAMGRRRRREDEPERAGNHRRRRDTLNDAPDEEYLDARGHRAGGGGQDEDLEPGQEDGSAAYVVGHPSGGGQHRREGNRIRADDPGQGRQRAAGERGAEVWEGDVDHSHVEEGDERCPGSNGQNASRVGRRNFGGR